METAENHPAPYQEKWASVLSHLLNVPCLIPALVGVGLSRRGGPLSHRALMGQGGHLANTLVDLGCCWGELGCGCAGLGLRAVLLGQRALLLWAGGWRGIADRSLRARQKDRLWANWITNAFNLYWKGQVLVLFFNLKDSDSRTFQAYTGFTDCRIY